MRIIICIVAVAVFLCSCNQVIEEEPRNNNVLTNDSVEQTQETKNN